MLTYIIFQNIVVVHYKCKQASDHILDKATTFQQHTNKSFALQEYWQGQTYPWHSPIVARNNTYFSI